MKNVISSSWIRRAAATGLCVLIVAQVLAEAAKPEARAELKNLSFDGGLSDGKARLTIEAALSGLGPKEEKLIYDTAVQQSIKVGPETLDHEFQIDLEILQGAPKELTLTIAGEGEIQQVTGSPLQDWSLRQETNQSRTLVLRPQKTDRPLSHLTVNVKAAQRIRAAATSVSALTLTPPQPAQFHGYVQVESAPELNIEAHQVTGLVPIESKFLPANMSPKVSAGAPEPLAFRFFGSGYSLPLEIAPADPETRRIVLRDFHLVGRLSEEQAAFTLTATARVRNPKGGKLDLLSGAVALSDLGPDAGWTVEFERGQFVLGVDHAGELPIRLQFKASVGQRDGWNAVSFRVAAASFAPMILEGLSDDTQLQFAGGARPERTGHQFSSYLPSSGEVNLAWKKAQAQTEGKLFYAAEMRSQISVSPGLMRQTALLDFKVVQGELNRVALRLHGPGEVTRVQGEQVLAWQVEPLANGPDRRLIVQLNQGQKDHFAFQVQAQTPLGAFPQAADVLQVRPENATRFTGYYRVVNDGAVRLEIAQAMGLSQISPEQFPESDGTKGLWRAEGTQRFAYRFSGGDIALRIQADQILPELSVSEVLYYRLGENEAAIDADLELEIREAPVRELVVLVPKGYSLARLTAPGSNDYFLRDLPDQPNAELRLVYGQPVTGRQLLQLRLERNQTLSATNWVLPRIEVSRSKSTRGHIGVAADAGIRVTAEQSQGLTEMATAFFPRKAAGLQLAFRLADPGWQANLRVERLPQTVQADALHLFSIGEGIAYGSSVLNYLISGAPVSAFQVELSSEYFNVEFTGKDVRNWQKTTNGYLVQLHSPVSGAYTLLAAYERPFKPQGETLAFTGARPLDAQSEQGHTLIISADQFQVQPVEVSPRLLPLETGEVPPEYRLLFDAPILAAYRYTARPFSLRLALSPLTQGDSLSQVVDRALLRTRVSKAGQLVTEARYFLKSRGHPNLRLAIPEGTQLWSALVNGSAVVPVADGQESLIPLPKRADPNALITVDLKLAARSKDAKQVAAAAPIVNAPVMLAEWKVEPDTGQRLVYRGGSLMPVEGAADRSGFAGLIRLLTGPQAGLAWFSFSAALMLVALAVVVWRWTTRPGVVRGSARFSVGFGLGLVALALAGVAFVKLADLSQHVSLELPGSLTMLAPVQQANSALTLQVSNLEAGFSVIALLGRVWPGVVALVLWAWTLSQRPSRMRTAWSLLGWVLLTWAALRAPNGALAFLAILVGFLLLQVLYSGLRRIMNLPKADTSEAGSPVAGGAAPATLAILLSGILWLLPGTSARAEGEPSHEPSLSRRTSPQSEPALELSKPGLPQQTGLAESVTQQIRVEDGYAIATAKIRWRAAKGQLLPVLFEPGVLTQMSYPTNALRLVQAPLSDQSACQLSAQENGIFDVEARYQVPVIQKETEHGFVLPTAYGLINEVILTLANVDVEVHSVQAVSIEPRRAGTNTLATLVLSPGPNAWIGWRPRSRDVRREKPVFYGEHYQLYVPSAGVVEGSDYMTVRPAQGELNELILDVPAGTTVTDVLDATKLDGTAPASSGATVARLPALLTPWRFDPDARKLRVTLNPPQSKPFSLVVRSQMAVGPLPFESSVGLMSLENATGQIGLFGLATGNEIQLDTANAEAFVPINLEDFPAIALRPLQGQVAGLTLRRAYRYADANSKAAFRASAVEPEVRVETQTTLSLGEDRTVLAANLAVDISRAGIFRLSFPLPAGFDVESISGDALSHWTESKLQADRVITLNLRGKTEGRQQFALSLTGAGVRAGQGWVVPRLVLREASKQQGNLLIVPEQGLRLQVAARSGLTQLDPQRSGIPQKGVLAYRILQEPWNLTLDLQQVDPWIQVTSLQHSMVNEALVKVTANLQYQIENTGLKAFRVLLATNAENVRFQGEQVSDFRLLPDGATNGLRQWEVKLHRRVIGAYFLQVRYQLAVPEQASELLLRGLQAVDANSQRGFVTVQSSGRLQVRVDPLPPALQPAEWQSIPPALQQDLPAAAANIACRLIDPGFQLPVRLERHEATKLLPARVNQVTLNSVVSDTGVMLTQLRIDLLPGDKRLLYLTLPRNARFWFAFVNQNGVWPWREQDRILIPLEQQSRDAKPIPVEIFYSSQAGAADGRTLDLELAAPQFDLPLESITWQVYLNERWQLKHWTGALQLEERQIVARPTAVDLQTYLQSEASAQREKTKEAEQMLALGNSDLQQGNQQRARRAFQAAFGLSQGDNAFNEDARVQLNNLKVQQALVALNVRQAAVAGETDAFAAKLRELRSREDINYSQQDAQAIIARNSAEENAAFTRLAQRLVQQQDAALSSPAAIRTSIPNQGQLFTFKRAVLVDAWSDLSLHLVANAAQTASWQVRTLTLLATAILMALFAWAAGANAPELD